MEEEAGATDRVDLQQQVTDEALLRAPSQKSDQNIPGSGYSNYLDQPVKPTRDTHHLPGIGILPINDVVLESKQSKHG